MSETLRVDLAVSARPVTVFGAAGAALGRIAALRDAGARITVVAENASPAVADLADRGLLAWHARPYHPSDLERARLVVAATGDPELDAQIARDAEDRDLWCVRAPTRDREVEPGADPAAGPARGEVVLVGGGPGDPGLLTVAGLEAVRRADVVIVDRLAPLAALEEAPQDAVVVDVAKIPDLATTPQQTINRLLVEHASAGRRVVRLKGGDAFVFGRGGEELQACHAAGIPVRVVPGVTSALAVPAAANVPMTHRGTNQGFAVVSGHVPPGDPRSTVDYAALARSGTSLVLLMAIKTLGAITHALLEAGLDPETPAVTIADGTLPSQRVVRTTLSEIAPRVAAQRIGPPAITVIGAAAGFDPHG